MPRGIGKPPASEQDFSLTVQGVDLVVIHRSLTVEFQLSSGVKIFEVNRRGLLHNEMSLISAIAFANVYIDAYDEGLAKGKEVAQVAMRKALGFETNDSK